MYKNLETAQRLIYDLHIENLTRCNSVLNFISYKYEINLDTLLHIVEFSI